VTQEIRNILQRGATLNKSLHGHMSQHVWAMGQRINATARRCTTDDPTHDAGSHWRIKWRAMPSEQRTTLQSGPAMAQIRCDGSSRCFWKGQQIGAYIFAVDLQCPSVPINVVECYARHFRSSQPKINEAPRDRVITSPDHRTPIKSTQKMLEFIRG